MAFVHIVVLHGQKGNETTPQKALFMHFPQLVYLNHLWILNIFSTLKEPRCKASALMNKCILLFSNRLMMLVIILSEDFAELLLQWALKFWSRNSSLWMQSSTLRKFQICINVFYREAEFCIKIGLYILICEGDFVQRLDRAPMDCSSADY